MTTSAPLRHAFPPPPRHIVTPRLVLRAYTQAHAPLFMDAIAASLDALAQWTPWIIPEPYDVSTLEQRLQNFAQMYDAGTAFAYAVLAPDESQAIGHAGLFGRVGPDALEVGYFIRSDMTGRGYAGEVAQALVAAAFAHCGVQRVEMHCDAENVRSIAVPLRLGFREAARTEDGGRTIIVFTRGA